jgi:hypothetical protein
MADEEKDLRASLSEAFETHDTDTTTEEAASEDNTEALPGGETTEDAPAADVSDATDTTEASALVDEAIAETAEAPAAPAAGKAPAAKATEKAGEAAAKTVGIKAPNSWKPAMREKWSSLPKEIQQEISRRERDINKGMHESGEARRFQNEFERTVQPFQTFIAAENSTPLKAVQNMMQTAATLRVGSPQQKAQTVAHLIKNFGIDVKTLDSMLAGSYQTDPVQRQIQEAVAPVQEIVNRYQAQEAGRHAELNQNVGNELETFAADPANEFFEDVRDTMADIMDMATNRGQKIDLSTAYNRAIMMHDDIADVVTQRKLLEQAKSKNASTQAARKKAVSISGAPTVGGDAEPTVSMRQDIERAIAARSNG